MFLSFYNPYTSPNSILHVIFLTFRANFGTGKVAPNGERRKLANEQAGESQESRLFRRSWCILFFPTSFMKISLNLKLLYNYSTPIFFDFPDLEFQLMQITVF
jgi:hypothetical protein